MEQTEKQTVTDPAIIREYKEAVTEYGTACEKTLEQEKVIRHVRQQTTEFVFNLPSHGGDIEEWDSDAAEKLACQLDLVASAHSEQAERLHKQVRALRRMNRAVGTVRDEVTKNENDQPAAR
jgi:hypothetical protein